MSNKKKIHNDKVLGRFLDSEAKSQVYARIPESLHKKFLGIVQSENISIYEAIEIACTLLVDYYNHPEFRSFYEKLKDKD